MKVFVAVVVCALHDSTPACPHRSEEHTSELQSQSNLVCRLLLEKKKKLSYSDASIPKQRYGRHTVPSAIRFPTRHRANPMSRRSFQSLSAVADRPLCIFTLSTRIAPDSSTRGLEQDAA